MAETYIYGAYDTKSYSNHWRARIGYEYTQNSTNKTSTVTLKLYVYNGYTSSNSVANQAYYKLMDNTTHYKTYNFTTEKKWNLIATTTKTVTHDSKGKASLNVNGTWCSGMSSATWTPYTLTVSGTITFKDIPVASTVSATNANIGSASTISIKAFSTTYKHTLSYKINNGAYTQIATNVGSSYSWTLPKSLNDVLSAAATKLGMTIKCETFNGSTSLGTTTCSLTGYAVEADLKPVLSATIVDTNTSAIALTGNSSKLIKYYSNAQVTTTATAYGNASIASYKIVNGSKSITSATGTINAVESNKFTISATDTRGFTTTISLEPAMVNYIIPQISFTAQVTNPAQGKISYNLNSNSFSGSFGNVSNIVTKKLKYREVGTTEWVETTVTSDSGEFTLDYRKSWEIKAAIYDKIYTTPKESNSFKLVFEPAFYWNNDSFYFNQNVDAKGDITFDEGSQTGERNIFLESKSGTYTHKAKLYGGNPSSKTAIGLYDSKNGKTVLQYNDVDNKITIGESDTGVTVGGKDLDVIGTVCSVIGTVYSSEVTSKSIPNNTTTNLTTLSVPAGTYVIVGNHQWNETTSFLYADSWGNVDGTVFRNNTTGGGGSLTTIHSFSATTTIQYKTWQGSGAARTASTIRLYAIRIK